MNKYLTTIVSIIFIASWLLKHVGVIKPTASDSYIESKKEAG